MPWPLIAAAAGAVLAGGSKIAASFAQSRAERIASEVRVVEAMAQAKNQQYAGVREYWAQEFGSQADKTRDMYERYLADNYLSQQEVDSIELPPEVRKSLDNLHVLPPPIIDLHSCESGKAVMQASSRLFMRGQTLRYTNPQRANAAQNLAMAGAISGYIQNNLAQVTATDTYEGKAREHMAKLASLVAAFDAAFERDLLEDQRSSKRAGDYVSGLVQRSRLGAPSERDFTVVTAAACKEYWHYLVALSARYSSASSAAEGPR